jgi:hypothetical protein
VSLVQNRPSEAVSNHRPATVIHSVSRRQSLTKRFSADDLQAACENTPTVGVFLPPPKMHSSESGEIIDRMRTRGRLDIRLTSTPRHLAIYGGREDIGVGVKTKLPLSGSDGRRPAQYYLAAPGNKPTHPVSAATLLAPRSVRAGVGVVVVLVAAAALLAPWNVWAGVGVVVVVDQPEGVYFPLPLVEKGASIPPN